MQWLELTVHTTTAAIDLLAAELTVLGYDSFIIDDQADFHKFLEENRQYWDYVDAELEERMRGLSQIRLYLEENAGVMDEVAALQQALAHWRTRCPVDPGTLEITCRPCRMRTGRTTGSSITSPSPSVRGCWSCPNG